MNKSFSLIAALGLVLVGCTDGSENPINDVLDNTTKGAALRTLNSAFPAISFGSTEGSFTGTFEIQADPTADITSVEVYSEFIDNSDANGPGDTSGLLSTITTFEQTEFGLKGFDYTVQYAEILAASGATQAGVQPGDQFRLRFELVAADGRTFSVKQLTGTLTGGYFRSPFQFTTNVICSPIVPTAGTWRVISVDSYGDGWNGGTLSVTIDGNDPISLTNSLDNGGPYPDSTTEELTFEVPVGAMAIQIVYNAGSFDEEVSFQVVSANGATILDLGPEPQTAAGLIDYCLDIEL